MRSSASDSSARPRDLEAAISARTLDFDVCALLDTLADIAPPEGYEVHLEAHDAISPQPGWLHAVRFPEGGPPAAAIAANVGLLSCRSPLPSYFRRLMEDPEVSDPLRELLRLLDQRLLEGRFASYRPEHDPRLFPDRGELRRDMLALSALRSPAALQWLFRKVFPELRAAARRAPQDLSLRAPDARLGAAKLSVAALGGVARVPARGVEVTLIAEGRLSPVREQPDPDAPLRPWPAEARARIDARVLPALRGTGLHLAVHLLILDEEALARLRPVTEGADSADGAPLPGHVGYDLLKPEPAPPDPWVPPRAPARITLFAGPIPEDGGA